MDKAEEQPDFQQFISRWTVETLGETVLFRLVRRDVMPLDADLAAPRQHGVAGEFRLCPENYPPTT